MLIDTHVHLDHYHKPLEIAIESEKTKIITIAVTSLPSHFEMALPHLKAFRYVRLALGMHPLMPILKMLIDVCLLLFPITRNQILPENRLAVRLI